MNQFVYFIILLFYNEFGGYGMIYTRILTNSTYNSLKLLYLNRVIEETTDVERAQVVMGTETNKAFLKDIDLYHEAIEAADANEMVVVIEAEKETLIDEIIEKAEDRLDQEPTRSKARRNEERPNLQVVKDYLSQKEMKSQFFFRKDSSQRKMGKIHSVFQTSFNVLFGDDLLNFVTLGMPLTPHGIALNKKTIDQVLEKGTPGDLVKVEEKVFTFYTRNGVFEIDASKVETVSYNVPSYDLMAEDIIQSTLYSILDNLPFSEHIGLEKEGRVEESLVTLIEFSKQTDQEIQEAVEYLIGRGNGLTPSGDDILLGYTMIRQAFAMDDAFRSFLKRGTENKSTTAVSMAYYEGLFAGYISSLFLALLDALVSEDFNQTKEMVHMITFYGHTSGYDTLYGFYLGLQALIKER